MASADAPRQHLFCGVTRFLINGDQCQICPTAFNGTMVHCIEAGNLIVFERIFVQLESGLNLRSAERN